MVFMRFKCDQVFISCRVILRGPKIGSIHTFIFGRTKPFLKNHRATTFEFYGDTILVDNLRRLVSCYHWSNPFFYGFAVAHPNTAEYLEAFWYDVPKIAALSEQKWEDFDQIRLDRQRGRIAKGNCMLAVFLFLLRVSSLVRSLFLSYADCPVAVAVDWASDVPCEETTGKRLLLPLMGRTPRAYPNYRNILGAQLGGESFVSMSVSEEKDGETQNPPSRKRGLWSVTPQR